MGVIRCDRTQDTTTRQQIVNVLPSVYKLYSHVTRDLPPSAAIASMMQHHSVLFFALHLRIA